MRKSCKHYATADNYVSAVPFLQKHYNNKMYNRYQVQAFFLHKVWSQEWVERNSHRQLYCEVRRAYTCDNQYLLSRISIIDVDDGEIVESWDYYTPCDVWYYRYLVCTF